MGAPALARPAPRALGGGPSRSSSSVMRPAGAGARSADLQGAFVLDASRARARSDGAIDSVNVYAGAGTSASTIWVGVYANSSGKPGARLAGGSLAAPVARHWNSVALGVSRRLLAGRLYWISVSAKGGALILRAESGGCTAASARAGGWSGQGIGLEAGMFGLGLRSSRDKPDRAAGHARHREHRSAGALAAITPGPGRTARPAGRHNAAGDHRCRDRRPDAQGFKRRMDGKPDVLHLRLGGLQQLGGCLHEDRQRSFGLLHAAGERSGLNDRRGGHGEQLTRLGTGRLLADGRSEHSRPAQAGQHLAAEHHRLSRRRPDPESCPWNMD